MGELSIFNHAYRTLLYIGWLRAQYPDQIIYRFKIVTNTFILTLILKIK